MNSFLCLEGGGAVIYDTETAIRAWSTALLRILERFKNVRGPITEHVFTYARRKMPGGFAFHALLTVSVITVFQ